MTTSVAAAQAPDPWARVGIGPLEAQQWREAGVQFAEWANQWKAEGFTAAEARDWVGASVDVYTAGDFRDAGFGVAETTGWIDSGVRSALRAKEFRDLGFAPSEAGEWWRLEFFPDDAADWRKEGLGPQTALEWKYGEKEYAYSGRSKIWHRSVYSVEWARPWIAAGFAAAEARLARDYGIAFAEADAWRHAGFGFEEAVGWNDAGFTTEEAVRLKGAGLGAAEADERQNSYSESDVVTSFHADVTLRPDARVEVTETILVSNAPGGILDRCLPRRFPAYISLRRTNSSAIEGFPSYRVASVLQRSLFALVESYPALKADARFQELMTQLRELEDNIEYARRYYNATVRDYNVATAVFPSRIIAAAFAFTPEEFFELDNPVEERKPAEVAFS